jgi:hypothetical protein
LGYHVSIDEDRAMRKHLTMAAIIAASFLNMTSVAAAGCVADQHGSLICGEGKDAARVFAETVSPSKKFAFAWRTANGLPSGRELPVADIENVLIGLDDGVVLAKLGGQYWATGEMIANRYQQLAAWSPDSRAVVEVANSRWDTDAFAYYMIDGEKVIKLDLLALVAPALKAKIPASRRESYSFRVLNGLGVTLDPRGRLRFKASLYVPKAETSRDYSIAVDITARRGEPSARIVSMQKVTIDPRL